MWHWLAPVAQRTIHREELNACDRASEHRSDRRELPGRAGYGERKEHDVPGHVGDEDVSKRQIAHGIDETRHHGQGEKRSVRSGRLSGSGTPVPASRLKELDRVTRGIVDQDL